MPARPAACRRPCSTAARARRAPSSARRGAASRRPARTGSAGRGSSRRRPRAPEPRHGRRRGRPPAGNQDPGRALGVGEDLARGVVKRQAAQDPRLRVGVREHAPGRRIHEEQLAGRQAAGAHDLARVERHRARLGRDGDQAIGGDRPRRRSQAVAVEQRADPAAVAEHERARAVPRRDEAGDPPAEGGDGGVRRPAQARRLGHQREQRGLERPAGRDQQLERLVERPRVRHARREEGTGRAEAVGRVPAARGDAGVVAPAADRLAIAAHGVDLAVVGDVPERLGERPHGLRVRGVALVEQGEREVDGRGEVGEQAGEAAAGDEALVDDGLRRRRDHRERRQAGRACRGVGAAAGAGRARARTRGRTRRPAAGPAPGGSRAGRRRPRGRGHRARRAPCARRARPGLRRRARRRRSSAGSRPGPSRGGGRVRRP